MSRLFPIHLLRTVLQPISQSHVTVGKIDRILPSHFQRHGVLLRQDQAHNLAQSDVLKKKLDMDMVRRKLGWNIGFILDEIVLRYHFNIGIVGIDMDWATQCDGYRSITCEQGPPNSLPQAFVCPAELRAFNAAAS